MRTFRKYVSSSSAHVGGGKADFWDGFLYLAVSLLEIGVNNGKSEIGDPIHGSQSILDSLRYCRRMSFVSGSRDFASGDSYIGPMGLPLACQDP